eukprot:8445187-Pyramimonas_sp.AAC.1
MHRWRTRVSDCLTDHHAKIVDMCLPSGKREESRAQGRQLKEAAGRVVSQRKPRPLAIGLLRGKSRKSDLARERYVHETDRLAQEAPIDCSWPEVARMCVDSMESVAPRGRRNLG